MLCERCAPGRCVGCPSDVCPIEITCPGCEESGCDKCDQRGTFVVSGCPKKLLDAELIQAIKFAEHFRNGIPLISGGVLDHSSWFMSLVETYEFENAIAEAEVYRRMRK